MSSSDYIGSVTINGKNIDIGVDDYGQCYYFEFINDAGEKEQIGCGTYNLHFLEEIYGFFDFKGTTISLDGQEAWDSYIANLYKWRDAEPEHSQHYQKLIDKYENAPYQIYNFSQMYEEFTGGVYNAND